MKDEKMKKKNYSIAGLIVLAVVAVLLIAAVLYVSLHYGKNTFISPDQQPVQQEENEQIQPEPQPEQQPEQQPEEKEDPPILPTALYAAEDESAWELELQVYSSGAILIDAETNTVICEKDADAVIYPASMTKIMTALVACENIENWDDTYTMTQDIIDAVYLEDLTMAGFLAGEQVNMRDLLFGAILPSGAEATTALANYIAGSEEKFVELMNQKAQELGLESCHFADASGLHNEEHYCTIRDVAVILQAALQNEICKEVLSTVNYTSTPTEQNPEGVSMTNKFLALIELEDLGGAQILAAKTGYTAQAGNCCASYGISPNGRACICVTANAPDSQLTIKDHVALYSLYADPVR